MKEAGVNDGVSHLCLLAMVSADGSGVVSSSRPHNAPDAVNMIGCNSFP